MSKKPEYVCVEILDGRECFVDRRVVERQPDGTLVMRDPITGIAYTTAGNKLPRGWTWEQAQQIRAGGVELLQVEKHDHPEPMICQWTNTEISWIKKYAQDYGDRRAAAANLRIAGLESECKAWALTVESLEKDAAPMTFNIGERVRKKSGAAWHGRIVGQYSTKLTPEGYAVESEAQPGSVQIYPAAALECAT